jgi:hypothetical protein
MKKEEPRHSPKKADPHTFLFMNTRGGTVAVSCFHIWIETKAIIKTPNRTKSAIMRPLDHSYLEPPHCRASSKQMTPGMKQMVPSMSSTRILSLRVEPACRAFLGDGKKKRMKTAVTAPKGRLM